MENPKNNPETPQIYTYLVHQINPLDPDPDLIRIEDIAHSLACCNRFAGHAEEPISVAQHSVWASWLCDESCALQALLHDASEAYLGDVTKWLKGTPEFEAYRNSEARVQSMIYRKFGCPEEDHNQVKWADKVLVRYEMIQGFGGQATVGALNPKRESDYPPLTDHELHLMNGWKFWDWRESERRFLKQFDTLYHGIHRDPNQ